MKQGAMRFRGYSFPSNPYTVELAGNREVKRITLPLLGETVQDFGRGVQTIKGRGVFAGAGAYDSYLELQKEFERGGTGTLLVPGFRPICAVFSALRLTAPPEPDTAEYEFEFVQKQTQVLKKRATEEYRMGEGESLWNVAVKFGVSIDRLMELNPRYPDPFAPKQGEGVKLC